MSRHIVLLGIAMLGLFGALPASSTVVVDHVFVGPASFTFGDTIQIEVRLSWDGQGALRGVFSSTAYDPGVLQFVSATSAPADILTWTELNDEGNLDVIPGLTRWMQPAIVGGSLRTVQYAHPLPDPLETVDPRAQNAGGAGRLITTLAFRVVGFGQTNVAAFLASGDSGAIGDQFVSGASVCVWTDGLCTPPVPEPATATLIGLGLAGLALGGRWDRA